MTTAETESISPDAGLLVGVQLSGADGYGAEATAEGRQGLVQTSRKCLEKPNLDPAHCAIVRMRNDWMEPTLPKGCAIWVDCASIELQPSRIVALRSDEYSTVRWTVMGDDGRFVLVLEDLGDIESRDQIEGASLDRARHAIRAIARLHAFYRGRVNVPGMGFNPRKGQGCTPRRVRSGRGR